MFETWRCNPPLTVRSVQMVEQLAGWTVGLLNVNLRAGGRETGLVASNPPHNPLTPLLSLTRGSPNIWAASGGTASISTSRNSTW